MSDKKFVGRVALVTGAGRGIGRAIAMGFAQEGADIAAVARTESELNSTAQEIRALGRTVVAIPADLSDPSLPRQIVEQVVRELGSVDILVNNAGVGSSIDPRPLLDFDDNIWNLTMAINLTAPYLLCKAVLPILLEKKKGRIINIASLAAKTGLLHGCAYSASKHGLLGLTRSLAIEVADTGVTVNAICPGPVHTRSNNIRIRHDADRLGVPLEDVVSRLTPMHRRLEPEEMVPMAIFLASDESWVITGQAFNVCCGAAMY